MNGPFTFCYIIYIMLSKLMKNKASMLSYRPYSLLAIYANDLLLFVLLKNIFRILKIIH